MDSDHIASVLGQIGINIQKTVETDYIIYCPFHSNYRTPAGEVSKTTGMFYCFSCFETCSLEELVVQATDKSIYEAMRLVRSDRTNVDVLASINATLAQKSVGLEEFDHALIHKLHNDCVTTERSMQYWYGRGLSVDTIDKFNLGYSANQDMSIIPVHSPRGMLMGFVGRSISGPKRFKNSTGMKKSRTLFNLHRVKASREITIVESAIDAMLLDQVGIPAVATLGASLSKEQTKLLTNTFNSVNLVPDADEAGRAMALKLSKIFGPGLTVMGLPANAKDVGELTEDELEILGKKITDPLKGLTI